jgi:hypothetical protein
MVLLAVRNLYVGTKIGVATFDTNRSVTDSTRTVNCCCIPEASCLCSPVSTAGHRQAMCQQKRTDYRSVWGERWFVTCNVHKAYTNVGIWFHIWLTVGRWGFLSKFCSFLTVLSATVDWEAACVYSRVTQNNSKHTFWLPFILRKYSVIIKQLQQTPELIFYVHVTAHCGKFLIIKPTRCTNFSNLFWKWNSSCFGQFLCPSSGVIHSTLSNGMCHTDSFRAAAGSGWSCSSILILLLLRESCLQTRLDNLEEIKVSC